MPETNGEPAVDPHTAPHDEIVGLVRELIEHAGDGAVSIDTLANALKSRGFRRPPGSPRLITRLRRIREITIDRAGRITLVDGASGGPRPVVERPVVERPVVEDHAPAEPGNRALPPRVVEHGPDEEPTPGNEIEGGPGREPPGEVPPERSHHRSRRGGRGRRRGRSGAPAAP
jgi:hypothetical protein